MMNSIATRFLLCLLLLAIESACSEAPPRGAAGPRNVILICLDTVRADHLGTYGYARATTPNLDALAARALVFSDASATAGWTKPSVPSFLTGTFPAQHGVYEGSAHDEAGEVTDLLPQRALTLAEVFKERGYRTGAFVHNAQLRAGNGFEQGFDQYEQDNWDAREIRWRGLDWIDRAGTGPSGDEDRPAQARPQPFFLYLHFLDAHWPYPAPEEWVTRFATAAATERFRGKDSKALYSSINDGGYTMTPADRAALEALYDGAIAYLDAELGRLFAGLELRGLMDDTIVCVLADHGEEFGEHGKVGHGHGLWQDLLHVPWILTLPGRAPARNDSPVSLIDLFPTLLAAASLPAPPDLAGVNRLNDPQAANPIFAEHKAPNRYLQSLRIGNEKLLRRFTPPTGGEAAELVLPVKAGTRWEAECELREGALFATQLKPHTEELSDPPELKGRIESLTPTEFQIGGVRVRYGPESHMQTDVGTSGPELANGQIVKARGPLAEGVMQAERVKFYAPDESTELEIRATVAGLEQAQGSGTIDLGGFSLRFTPETQLKDSERRPGKRKFTRDDIATLIDGGLGAQAAANQYEVTRELYDLASDGAELTARADRAGSALDARMDELGVALARNRIFGAKDQKTLDAAAVRALQDIGYGGGE